LIELQDETAIYDFPRVNLDWEQTVDRNTVVHIVMTLMGFGNVTAEELLATSTPAEIARMIRILSKRTQN